MDLSNGLAKRILEAAPDPTIVAAADGIVVYANARIEAVLGYKPGDLVGSPVEALLPVRLRTPHTKHRAQYAAHPTSRPMGKGLELFALHKDGHEVPVEISLSPVQGESGMLTVSAIRDVSVQKALARELVEANRAKSRFLAAASHDLRQPIQTLNLLNSAAGRADTEEARQLIIEKQQRSLNAMGRLLNSLLDISKLEAGIVKPDITDCAVQEIFSDLNAEFEEQAKEKGIDLVVEPSAEVIRSDRQFLMQILENLLSNAIRYTHEGLVRLQCVRQDRLVRIDVLDTGIGISSEDLGIVFDEFRQIDFGTRRPEGLGLGLSIVNRTAELLGCPLEVESEVGAGSRFSVAVPLGKAKDVVERDSPGVYSRVSGGRILIVDDEPAVADATSMLLRFEGFDVEIAASVEEAEESVLEKPVDLVITDYHLRGGQTGLDVLHALRRVTRHDLPFIVVSGDTSGSIELDVVSDALLMTKPVDVEKMLTEIRRHIGPA